MIGKQRPGIHRPDTLPHDVLKPREEIAAVGVLVEDGGPLDAPHHHVVERVGRIQARVPWHDDRLPVPRMCVKLFPHQRPLYTPPYPALAQHLRAVTTHGLRELQRAGQRLRPIEEGAAPGLQDHQRPDPGGVVLAAADMLVEHAAYVSMVKEGA